MMKLFATMFAFAVICTGIAAAKPVTDLRYTPELFLNGLTNGVRLAKNRLHNPEKGISVMAVVRRKSLPRNNKLNSNHDMIVQRDKQFLLGFDNNRIYVNFHNGKDWVIPVMVKNPAPDSEFHALALTVKRFREISQGDDYLQIKIYFDGELIYNRNISGKNKSVADSSADITVGFSERFGEPWRLGGDIAAVSLYNRELGIGEIQQYVSRFPKIRHQPLGKVLDAGDSKLLASLPSKGGDAVLAAASALRNIARSSSKYDWRNAVKLLNAGKKVPFLRQYTIKNAIVSVLTEPGQAAVPSLYDTVGKRETLCSNNPWFRAKIKGVSFSPADPEFACDFKALPPVDGKQRFKLLWKHKVLNASAVFSCGDELDYVLEVSPVVKGTSIASVEFPALEMAPLSEDAVLLSPIMSGVAQKEAMKKQISFESVYPRAFGAMQYGALYDKTSGIYWSSADPKARVKKLFHNAGGSRMRVRHEWYPVRNRPFIPGSAARIAVYRGNWYEASMLYRKQIWEIKALWLPEEGLPRTDVAPWFRDNTFWLSLQIKSLASLNPLKAVREYLGLPFAVDIYYWNSKVWDRDYPHHRAQPAYLKALDECHRLGLKVLPYLNGRLWEKLDLREHDFEYSRRGKANCVMNPDGTRAESTFNKRQFGIICPFTAEYERVMRKACFNTVALGSDGLYMDQIGAAAHILCYDPKHGHAVPDDTAWFEHGHNKVFTRIRDELKAQNPDMVFTTEDNAETCIRNFDGMETWRWMFDQQVPAFSAVYSGYTQIVGLSFHMREKESSIPKLAWQLIGGGQLGWISADFLMHRENHNFRVYLKQLMRLRIAMLEFFNNGIMAPPAEFAMPVPHKRLRWGDHGTRMVNTPALYSSSWLWDDMLAVMVLNVSDAAHSNRIKFALPGKGRYRLLRFTADGKETEKTVQGNVSENFTTPQRGVELWLAIPENKNAGRLLTKVRGQYKIIASVPAEKDPFLPGKKENMGNWEPVAGILRINANKYKCMFLRGSMFPIRFLSHKYQKLGEIEWFDRIKIGDTLYHLDADRYAENKILENSPDKLVVRCTGTMCTIQKEDEPPVPLKAVYTYTFRANSPEIEIAAEVVCGTGKAAVSVPELLDVKCVADPDKMLFTAAPATRQANTYIRKGKIIIK